MLTAFGYRFDDEIPMMFRHLAKFDQNLGILHNEKYKITKDTCNNVQSTLVISN